MDWARILAFVTGMTDQELLARNEYLAAENRILKAMLKGLWLPKTSNSCVSMVQPAKDRLRNNVSEPLDRACAGCILAKRKVSPHLIIVAGVFRKNAPKMFFIEHDYVVRAFVPRRPDQALN
jgi:hypothetical protein